eukprot:3773224-Prorocentrum_lima.AAC.1
MPEFQTVVDITPILLSLPQIRNLGCSLNLTPDTVDWRVLAWATTTRRYNTATANTWLLISHAW